jgi:hypothetical protein
MQSGSARRLIKKYGGRAKTRRRKMTKTWREKVAEIKDHPSLALLGVGIEDLCNEAGSAALEEATDLCIQEAAKIATLSADALAMARLLAHKIRALKEADDE